MILRGMSGASTGASSGACLGHYLGHHLEHHLGHHVGHVWGIIYIYVFSPVRAAAAEGGNSGAPELRSSFLWKYTDTRRMGGDRSTGVWYRT